MCRMRERRRFFVAFLQCCTAGRSAGIPCLSPWERWPSAARTERANKLILSFKKRHAFICHRQRHTAFPLSVAFGDSSPSGRAKGLCPFCENKQSIKMTLISLILAIPRRESKGNRARFLFGGSRVEVFRRRGKRNPRLLNVSLVTFSTSRKSPHGVTGSSILPKVISKSAASIGRTPAPAVYLYICCLYTDGVTPSMRLNTAIKLLMFMYPDSSAICVMLLFVSRSSSFASATLRRFM